MSATTFRFSFSIAVLFLLTSATLVNPEQENDKKRIVVYLIGDSTAANKKPEVYPETGWGQVFNNYLDSLAVVDNHAVNGRSTKSFMNEKRWEKILEKLREGDYVFIEFGHNDEKTNKPEVGTQLPEFKQNLTRFIQETRTKNAIPVLLTPIARRSFKEGKYEETHGEYPAAMRSVAREQHVPLIDMHAKTVSLIRELGEEPAKKIYLWADSSQYKNYPNGVKDNTHFSEEGAHIMAKLVAEGITELKLPLAAYVKRQ